MNRANPARSPAADSGGADGDILTMSRRFKARPERLFDCFTKADLLARWWGPGKTVSAIKKLDARPGGAYAIEMREEDGTLYRLSGVFRTVERPKRLVYTWTWGDGILAGIETLVTLEFRAEGDETELRLRHEKLPSATARDRHREGWGGCFDRLDKEAGA